jgi:hypothetical protein
MAKPEPFNPENWRYEFEDWEERMGGIPDRLLGSHDRSESYEMNRAHVFRIRPGRYVFVIESGCSCYQSSDACIYVYGSEREAMSDFFRWKDRATWDYNPTGVEVK